jgi:hypothetical protein
MLKFSQLLNSEGIILFADSENNVWEIVKRKDLKPEDLTDNLDTICSITNSNNYYVEDGMLSHKQGGGEESEIGVSMEVDVSRFSDVVSQNRIQVTVNDMSEIIIQ